MKSTRSDTRLRARTRTGAALAAALATLLLPAMTQAAQAAEPADVSTLIEQEKATSQVYRAYYPSADIARKAAISFHDHLLESHYAAGYLVMELDAATMDKLRAFGFRFELASDFIAQRNRILNALQARRAAGSKANLLGRDAAGRTSTTSSSTTSSSTTAAAAATLEAAAVAAAIPNFSCYETVEETFTTAQGFVAMRPDLATWIDIGDSWQKTVAQGGYDLQVLKLTNSALPGPKPKLFVNAAIHAREYTTAPLVLEFARWLLNGHGTVADATWILDHHEVHLLLQTNPDGRKYAESGLSWRKNTNNAYCANTNTRGADLNRNFTYSWNTTAGQGSSGAQCDLTYRGPTAGSEPEVQAVQNYVRTLWPDRRGPALTDAAPADTSGIHLDIHSYSQLVLWPWGTTTTPAPNGTALQTLGRKFAFFNGYTPEQSIGLYPTDGTSDSVSYGELGVAAYTIELGTAFFESCANYENVIKPGNLPALIYAAKVVRTPYLTPAGPDLTALSLSHNASGTGVLAGTVVTVSGSATDARFNNSNGIEATQAIAGAEAYVDVPPWSPGAVAIPLAATDGAFSSVTEGLTGTLNTAGLSPGAHLVYVRARDASGAWGAVTAGFLRVTTTPPPLSAAFTATCSALTCGFDASASGGAIGSYQWTFGDGTGATGVVASHAYAAGGSFTVMLTVGDGTGTASSSQTVTVQPPVVVTPVNEVENNNSRNAAQLITPNPALVSGTISTRRDTDYYRVSLAAGRTLSVALAPNTTSDYDLVLYNANGTVISQSQLGTGQVERLSVTNTGSAAATVYARVVYFSGGTGSTAGRYTLSLSQ